MIRRYLAPIIRECISQFPVVLLVGARQVGKSTLAQHLIDESWKARYVSLDDRTALDAALMSPDGFVREGPTPCIIDEIQRAPDLLRAIKLDVDAHRKPGRFLLTGSANVLTLARVSETLAGRVAVRELAPFSWGELREDPPPLAVDALFEARSVRTLLKLLRPPPRVPRLKEIQDFVLSGGYPVPALMAPGRVRATWFESYRQTYIEGDLRDLANLAHVPDFGRLMTTLALRTGQLLNVSELSRDVGLSVTTLRRYFNILMQTFQIFLVHPYSVNIRKRLVKTPKIYFADTGVACHLGAVDRWETLERQGRIGSMVETWVAGELRKMLSWTSHRTDLWYWRTHDGREADFILERGGEVAGIEVKWHAGFEEKDLAGLRDCADALGDRWRFGLLLHGGDETVVVDAHTVAVPLASFFRTRE
jgi:uncharacterized protein